jgi:hypothetical protein
MARLVSSIFIFAATNTHLLRIDRDAHLPRPAAVALALGQQFSFTPLAKPLSQEPQGDRNQKAKQKEQHEEKVRIEGKEIPPTQKDQNGYNKSDDHPNDIHACLPSVMPDFKAYLR